MWVGVTLGRVEWAYVGLCGMKWGDVVVPIVMIVNQV